MPYGTSVYGTAVYEAAGGTSQALAGTTAGSSGGTGSLTVTHTLAGTTAGTSASTGTLKAAYALAGTTIGASSLTGGLQGTGTPPNISLPTLVTGTLRLTLASAASRLSLASASMRTTSIDANTRVSAAAATSRLTGVAEASTVVDPFAEPFVMAHRGGGQTSQDNAVESMQYAAANFTGMNVFDGGDVQISSDGGLICMHDTTTGRTGSTNLTVSTSTLAALQAVNLLTWNTDFNYANETAAATSVHPPTFAQWLTTAASLGKAVTPETKLPGNSTVTQAMVNAIVAAGMTSKVIFQSSTIGDLAVPKAAGMKTCYLDFNGSLSAASVAAAAPDHYSYQYTVITDQRLLDIKAALPNVRLAPWTFTYRNELATEQARLATLGLGLSWIASNDPYWTGPSTIAPVLTTDPYGTYGPRYNTTGTGIVWPGSRMGTATLVRPKFVLSGATWRLQFAYTGAGSGGIYQAFNLQGWGCKEAAWTALEVDVTYDTLDSGTTRWPGIVWNCVDDRPFDDLSTASAANARGYTCFLRQNGQLQIFKRTGGTATSLATAVQTTAPTAGQTIRLRVENLGTGAIRLTRKDTSESITSSVDTTYRGGYFWFGKASSGSATPPNGVYSYSNVQLFP